MKYDAFFVSSSVHERPVTLADGSVHTLYFREVPAGEYRRFALAENSEDEDVRIGALAKLICASMCEADGTPAITFDQALQLKPSVATALLEAVLEVNGSGKDSVPEPSNGSGTSSRSRSARPSAN